MYGDKNAMRQAVRPRILVAFGTRPEAIKMAPVISALREAGRFTVRIVVTAQHREMLDEVLNLSGIEPDIDLDVMQEGQSLDVLASRILNRFGTALDDEQPDRVLVQGDTLTSTMTSLACMFRRIPVGHVEAGLRSGDMASPWPEEALRRMTGVLADLHFAPTDAAAAALLAENVSEDAIYVTGNTVIDALLAARKRVERDPSRAHTLADLKGRFAGKRLVAVTTHRRESFGPGLEQIATALRRLAKREDIAIVFPMHPNPAIARVMRPALEGCPNVALLGPLSYHDFVALLSESALVLTDSGGIQEEAPSLGTPVLVLRDRTERPEGIAAGTAALVGTDPEAIVGATCRLLDDPGAHAEMAKASNPYGDGKAAKRIAEILAERHPILA